VSDCVYVKSIIGYNNTFNNYNVYVVAVLNDFQQLNTVVMKYIRKLGYIHQVDAYTYLTSEYYKDISNINSNNTYVNTTLKVAIGKPNALININKIASPSNIQNINVTYNKPMYVKPYPYTPNLSQYIPILATNNCKCIFDILENKKYYIINGNALILHSSYAISYLVREINS